MLRVFGAAVVVLTISQGLWSLLATGFIYFIRIKENFDMDDFEKHFEELVAKASGESITANVLESVALVNNLSIPVVKWIHAELFRDGHLLNGERGGVAPGTRDIHVVNENGGAFRSAVNAWLSNGQQVRGFDELPAGQYWKRIEWVLAYSSAVMSEKSEPIIVLRLAEG
jgi:hypothetical protein